MGWGGVGWVPTAPFPVVQVHTGGQETVQAAGSSGYGILPDPSTALQWSSARRTLFPATLAALNLEEPMPAHISHQAAVPQCQGLLTLRLNPGFLRARLRVCCQSIFADPSPLSHCKRT